jgi:SNF2 family DNA or RNA helicase
MPLYNQQHGTPSHGLAAVTAVAEPYRAGDAGEFRLEADIAGMLYTYQLEGVAWLYRLHTLQRGGILAGRSC